MNKPSSPATNNSTVFDLWRLHPRGSYFLARGGDRIPPPRQLNLGLTNKCNLRCTICGSQAALGHTKTPRHHMARELFEVVSEILFPVITEVELNSRGDPLLYPHIDDVFDAIERHQCLLKMQHNATLLTDAMIDKLKDKFGTLSLSIDAIGPLFAEIRRGGHWEKVEPGLAKLAALRNRKRLRLSFYPTIMQRNVHQMGDIVRWAHEHAIDSVVFHDYSPVKQSPETPPNADDKKRQIESIAEFLSREGSDMHVFYDALRIHLGQTTPLDPFPSPIKAQHGPMMMNFPTEAGTTKSHEKILCLSPWQSIDVSIDGHVSACCRGQAYPMGKIDSVESFADIWFGENYERLRNSLMRSEGTVTCPLPACVGCIKAYAPSYKDRVQAAPYTHNAAQSQLGFSCKAGCVEPMLEWRASTKNNAYFATVPLGLDFKAYTLQEDGRPLGPMIDSNNAEEPSHGAYFYFTENTAICTSSDNTDLLFNGRAYRFVANNLASQHPAIDQHSIARDDGMRFFLLLDPSWNDANVTVAINDKQLSALNDLDALKAGEEGFCLRGRTLYFSLGHVIDPRGQDCVITVSLAYPAPSVNGQNPPPEKV